MFDSTLSEQRVDAARKGSTHLVIVVVDQLDGERLLGGTVCDGHDARGRGAINHGPVKICADRCSSCTDFNGDLHVATGTKPGRNQRIRQSWLVHSEAQRVQCAVLPLKPDKFECDTPGILHNAVDRSLCAETDHTSVPVIANVDSHAPNHRCRSSARKAHLNRLGLLVRSVVGEGQ